jgi:hypothetical protein
MTSSSNSEKNSRVDLWPSRRSSSRTQTRNAQAPIEVWVIEVRERVPCIGKTQEAGILVPRRFRVCRSRRSQARTITRRVDKDSLPPLRNAVLSGVNYERERLVGRTVSPVDSVESRAQNIKRLVFVRDALARRRDAFDISRSIAAGSAASSTSRYARNVLGAGRGSMPAAADAVGDDPRAPRSDAPVRQDRDRLRRVDLERRLAVLVGAAGIAAPRDDVRRGVDRCAVAAASRSRHSIAVLPSRGWRLRPISRARSPLRPEQAAERTPLESRVRQRIR